MYRIDRSLDSLLSANSFRSFSSLSDPFDDRRNSARPRELLQSSSRRTLCAAGLADLRRRRSLRRTDREEESHSGPELVELSFLGNAENHVVDRFSTVAVAQELANCSETDVDRLPQSVSCP